MAQALSLETLPDVEYCIPLWLRDLQVKDATERVKARIQPHPVRPGARAAVVCFGPSLNATWTDVRDGGFDAIFSCSGAHKFLMERGIVPTHHVEVDPRAHKVQLIGQPSPTTEYLIASTCHREVFEHLSGCDVKLWHVFSNEAEAIRVLPPGEWALTGGSSVGLRTMAIARFLGFTELDVYGMDGCESDDYGKHAAAHPNQPKARKPLDYDGRTYWTTESMLVCAQGTWHELNEMPDVTARFHGDGLVQAMAKHYVRGAPVAASLGFAKPELISAEYARLNAQLHHDVMTYGVGGAKHAPTVRKLVAGLTTSLKRTPSVLDYGCGKGLLAKELEFPIWEYDPAIPEKADPPRPADLVVCTDVLEHVEPDHLSAVLGDLQRCVREVGYFVIHTGPAMKTLADGRNTHLIQQGARWWRSRLEAFFEVRPDAIKDLGHELRIVVGPTHGKRKLMGSVLRATVTA